MALDVEVDGQPGFPDGADEDVERLHARLGSELRDLVLLAEEADEPAHLGERLASGLFDRLERLPLALLVRVQEPPHGSGLHGHDADGMGDHVVQLAGDTSALLLHGPIGSEALLALQSTSPLAHLARVLCSPVDDESRQPRGSDEEADEEVVAGAAVEAADHP